jgi:hypoxanthine phosphoribosyltransferase
MPKVEQDIRAHFEAKDILFSEAELKAKTLEIAAQINRDYADTEPVLVGVLRGSVVFLADLVRALDIPHGVDFIAVYRPPFDPQAAIHPPVKILADIRMPIEGRDVIVVEGIIGTGYTLKYVLSYIGLSHPRSVSIATMLNRRTERRFYFPIRYSGFQLSQEFVVGFGLDYQQRFRNLPFVAEWRGQVAIPGIEG